MNLQLMFNKLKNKNINLVILDQVLISGSSFLVTILLINFVGLEEFGIFSFFWLIFLLINSFQLSSIISPMMTNSGLYEENKKSFYYGGVFIQQIILIIFILILLKIFFIISNHESFDLNIVKFQSLIFLIIIASQLYQFLRRYLFAEKKFIFSIFLDLFVNLILLISILYFYYFEVLNLEKIFLCFLFAYLFGALLSLYLFKQLSFSKLAFVKSIKINIKIAKWLVFTYVLQWFSGNFWIIYAGILLGPIFLGAFRACQTVVNVFNLVFQSLENYYPNKISQIYKIGGNLSMKTYINKINSYGFFVILILALILALFSKQVLILFYGKEISEFYYLLISLSFLLPIIFIKYFYHFALRTLKNTRPIFVSYVFSSLFTITLSKIIIEKYQESGFVIGYMLTELILLIIAFYSFRKI